MNALVAVAVRRPRAVALLALLLVAAAVPGLLRLESDNSAAVYTPGSGAATERFRAFTARFGEGRPVRIVVEGDALWSAAGLAELARLEREARTIPCVVLAGALAARGLAKLETEPGLAPASLRATLLDDRLARALGWISADGNAASVLLELESAGGSARGARRDEAAACDRALDRLVASTGTGLRATLVGGRPLERALDRSADEILTLFSPLLVLFAVVLLAATFRDLGGVVVPLAFVFVCEATVLGAIGWSGARLHLVLAILPPLLFVIALATAVHLAIRCRALEAAGRDAVDATLTTYREKGGAVLWVSLSTACGFASLAVSDVTPVAELGRWATIGLAVQLLASFTLYPALLALTAGRRARLPERALEARLERLGRRIAEGASARRGAVLLVYLALAVAACAGLGRLEATSDPVAYFAADHPVRRALAAAEARGLGTSALELELLTGTAGSFSTPEAIERIARLAETLRAEAGIVSVASAAELVDDVGAASPWAELSTPAELRAQALALLAEDEEGRGALARFLTADGGAARLALFVPIAGYERLEPVAARAEALARARFPEADVAVTGVLRQVLAFHRSLVGTLALSLALTLPALAAVFFVLLRRPGEVVKALVPNVWPVMVLLGGMGWLGLRLDLATVMVASIVLGLAVDDTIHTLAHHREESRRLGAHAAVCRRIERTAPAYLLTGAILCAGFGVCALSDFEPIARFGALSAAAIALAVVSDLLLVPALFGGGVSTTPSAGRDGRLRVPDGAPDS